MKLAPLLAVVVFSGCAVSEIDVSAIESAAASIVMGVETSQYPAVGKIFRMKSLGEAFSCTGTLVGKKTVLTAAHCVVDENKVAWNLTGFEVGGQRYQIDKQFWHPNYAISDTMVAHDIGVIVLTSAPPVAAAMISTDSPTVLSDVALVGYGLTAEDANDSGIKRVATHVIDAKTSTELRYDNTTSGAGNLCFGDSGGPSFATINGHLAVVGVHSYILGESCGYQGRDMRADAYLLSITGAINDVYTTDNPPPAGSSTSNPSDLQAPSVQITSPASGTVSAPSISVDVSAFDNVGIKVVELRLNNTVVDLRYAAPYQFQVLIGQGTSTLTAVARDEAGNQSVDTISLTLSQPGQAQAGIDMQPPMVAIVTPVHGATVEATTTVQTTVIDDVGVAQVVCLVNGNVAQTLAQPPFNFQISLPQGSATITVEASDAAGNSSQQTVVVNVGQFSSNPPQANGLHNGAQPPYQDRYSQDISGGCSLGAGTRETLPVLLLVCLPLVLKRRRRSLVA